MDAAQLDAALWALGRGTGVVSLVALTLSVVLGILTRSGRPLPGLPRFSITLLHRNLSLLACVFLVIHIVSLFFDSFAQLTLLDIVIPFFGAFLPFWQGLGTVAVDLLIAVMVTALLRNRLGLRTFRAVHWLVYALWPIALAHGIGNGTDGTSPWFLWLAALSTALVLAAVAWRLAPRFVEYAAARAPSPDAALAPARPANAAPARTQLATPAAKRAFPSAPDAAATQARPATPNAATGPVLIPDAAAIPARAPKSQSTGEFPSVSGSITDRNSPVERANHALVPPGAAVAAADLGSYRATAAGPTGEVR